MILCECGKELKTKAGYKSHRRFCDGTGSKSSKKIQREYNIPNIESLTPDEIKREKLKQLWQFDDYRNKCLTNVTRNPNPKTQTGLESKRQKCRDAINKRYQNGWSPKAGRCKKILYKSNIAGQVLLDGTWELKVARYLDDNKINWVRNVNRFPYIDYNNKERTYCPDFYLSDTDVYIEVKGYKTKLDECKWTQFTKKLVIWDKKVLMEKGIL